MPTEESELDEFWTGHPAPEQVNTSENKSDKGVDDAIAADSLFFSDDDEITESKPNKPHIDNKPMADTRPLLLQLLPHRRAYADCWLALLRLPLTPAIYKKTLLIIHKRIIPHMPQPTMLMDFLTDSYNQGGSIALLALNGLFTLINEHNLDYPDFYPKLYQLLDRNVMHVKYRSRFFRLLTLFMSSKYLPTTLIAAFIKRFARLSLSAPPSGIVILIPMIYNLLKAHPICMSLIHRDTPTAVDQDPYNFDELDPYRCGAQESSLWEVKMLQEHYYPNVSSLAKIFSEKFDKQSFVLEDFLDHTYGSMIEADLARKQKKEPALAFETPKYLFKSSGKRLAVSGDNVGEQDGIQAIEEEQFDERWKSWKF
ncbi:uncharacterized protein VTP21DRAFT_571 [Calcarisporiella thermophila]|uniref:uncharacterized protein n=1 Tax=Calcarisporiella thermophila TaxID=911321 RepID=UPI0037434F8A